MTKYLPLKKVLATLLTIAALATGQQAFATVTQTVTFQGYAFTYNNTSYYSMEITSPWGNLQLPNQQGTYRYFSNVHLGWNPVDVTLNGNLRFKESTTPTDVVVYQGTFTVTIESQSLWFYGASVKKLDGTNVTNSSVTVSSDKHTVTVDINGVGTEFGQIILNYVPNEPFNSNNTVVSGIEPLYIWNGSPITFEPPTVTYNGNVLTEGTDYTVSYPDTGTNPLWYIWDESVTITGTGNYAGTFYQHFIYRNVNLTDFTQLNDGSYQIATQQDLDYLAFYVGTISQINNSYQYNYCEGLTFKQTADIAYTYTTAWNGSGNETNFTAIGGYNNKPFKGTFDGQNHTISGIRISKTGQANSDKCQGLFGIVDNGGTVRNVVLADTRIKGYTGTGGIVGTNYGTIEDCRVQNNVLVRSSGKVSAGNHGSDFGGIVGSNENGGTVTRCTSSVTIDSYVGLSTNPVQPTYSAYLGAIVGYNHGTVSNCLALNAKVTGSSYAAAIVGCNGSGYEMTANYYRGCTVTNSNHSNGSTGIGVGTDGGSQDQDGARSVHKLTLGTDITATGESVVIDGITYYASNTTVTLGYSGSVPAGQMPVYKVGSTTLEGDTFTMPTADRSVSVVGIVDAWSGSGTQGDPYVITTTAQLNALASAVKGGEAYSGTYFVLGNDIAYSTAGLGDTDENFTTIGGYFNGGDRNFSGTFDGQGYTISGIRLYKTGNSNPSKNQGLFGRISGATIKNVILTDARITGYRYVGGIVGNKASGTVQNCLVLESTITSENTYVGALFGGNSGTITANHYHGCTVNGTANATNVGVGGNGGTSSSSDKNGARSAHTLTLGENVTATGESVTYQGTTYYASNTTVTLGTVTYTLNGTALSGNTFTMPANDDAVVSAALQQTITLVSGWNWWAPMVEMTLQDLETALGTNGLIIQSVASGSYSYANGHWSVTSGNLVPGQMYRIKTSTACTISVTGVPVASVPVSLEPGTHWFGYTGSASTAVASVFVSPTPGDKVVSQTEGFAIFNGTSWEGTLTTLVPGKGYVYVSRAQAPMTVTF